MMIEALIGAVLLAMATFAVLNGLEGAQATGHSNKQRTVAATLAQQDIERLRAYPIASLSNFSQTRGVNVAGVAYSVTSVTEWIRDSTDALNCTDQTGQADYVKISSTVKSPAQKNAVKEVSLLTPAAGSLSDTNGTLAVKVTDRNGAARSGVTVTLSGPGSYSKLTNTLGCAVFDYIPVATYAVGVPGMVPWPARAPPTRRRPWSVARRASSRSRSTARLAAGHIQKPDGTSAMWNSIEVANAKLPGGAKDFPVATATTSIDGTGLFPFLDGVGVYAGTCQRNNPASWQSNYFSTSGKGYVVLAPGDVLKTVRVQMGVLNVNVKNYSSTPANMNGALVVVRQRDTGTGCDQDTWMAQGLTNSSGNVSFVMPFGTYRVCASGVPVPSTTRFFQTSAGSFTSGTNQDPRMRPASPMTFQSNINIPNSGSSGSCSTAADTSP